MASLAGPIELPSPKTSSVTPWRMSPSERPSTMSDSVAQLSMLMKPGDTAMPEASSTCAACAPERSPTAAMRSPRMATSPTTGGEPEPS